MDYSLGSNLLAGRHHDGNSSTGLRGSRLEAEFINMVGDELVELLLEADIIPEYTVRNQVATAVRIVAGKTAGFRFATMAEAKAAVAAEIVNLNESITIDGYYAPGDGGGLRGVVESTSRGNEIRIIPYGQFVDIRAFGATGDVNEDQDSAMVAAAESGLPVYVPPNLVFNHTTPLILKAPWVGYSTGQGNPGSATDTGTRYETSELRFSGTGWGVTTRSKFQHMTLRANTAVMGQSGLKMLGAAIGHTVGPVRTLEFDDKAFEIGGSVEQSGIYFADLTGLSAINKERLGTLGAHVIGGGTSSANANTITGLFINGPFETYLKVQGHNNTFLNADVNPRPSDVAALGGTIDAGVLIEGDGNTFINPYFEPTPGETSQYDCLIRFTSTASANKIENLYTPSAGARIAGLIEDFGTANSVTIAHIGENFTPSVGIPISEDNLIPNPGFVSPDANTIPDGWVVGAGTTGTITVDNTVTRRNTRTLKLSTSDTRAQANCFLLSASSTALKNASYFYSAETFAGATVSVGVWCLSNIAGLGSIKLKAGSSSFGVAMHSGSGDWEFLTVRTRATDAPDEVRIALRNSVSFKNTTGDCWFSEPIFVLGNDIPRHAGTRKLDAENAVLYGPMLYAPPQNLPDGETSPSVAAGNVFVEANTVATLITSFDDGRDGQEIKIVVTTSNTTLENNVNIKTNTGADKPLIIDRTYRLVRVSGVWRE